MASVFGLPVYVNRVMPASKPVLKLSPDIKVSSAFRKAYNEWLLNRFGEKPVFCITQVEDMFGYSKKVVVCHPTVEPRLYELAEQADRPPFLFNEN